MGRSGEEYQDRQNSKKNKSKGRMSYLKRQRTGKGGSSSDQKTDEHGQLYGDYAAAYGGSKSRGRGGRNQSGGGGGGRGRRAKDCIKSGMKGFLCTTNFKERECVREAYNILNGYCEPGVDVKMEEECSSDTTSSQDKVSETPLKQDGSEEQCEAAGTENAGGSLTSASENVRATKSMDEDEEDIDDALANELKDLKSEQTVRKFQSVDSGVSNVVFISTTIEDPTELAYRIFEDVVAKKQTKSMHLLRLMPIEMTCYAHNMDEVTAKAKEVFEKYLKTGYNSYKIVVNIRLNTKLKRDDLIKPLADLVSEINPLNFVDLNDGKFTIVVEVLKTTLCLGVVKEFNKFKKYNLLEAGVNPETAAVKVDATTDAGTKSETAALKVDAGATKDDAETSAKPESGSKVPATENADDSGVKDC